MKNSLLILFVIITSQLTIFAQWELSNSGITSGYIPSLALIGSDVFLSTMGSGVYISSDNGKSWSPRNSGLEEDNFIKCIAVSGNNIFAATGSNIIYRSSDKGLNWIQTTNTFDTIGIYVVYSNGKDVFVGTPGAGVFISTDDGLTWNQKNVGLTNKYVYNFLVDGTDIYAGTATWIFKSTNYGESWELKNSGLENKYLHGMTKFGSKILVGTEDGIFLSSDKGETWNNSSNGLTQQQSKWVYDFEFSGSHIFAATLNGVYVSSDTGRSWIGKNVGMENIGIYSLKIINDYLIAGTSTMKGLYRIKYSDLLTGIDSDPISADPDLIIISNCSSEKLQFRLKEEYSNKLLSIAITDIIGNSIRQNDFQANSIGDNIYEIDISSLNSGIYLCSVNSDKRTNTFQFIVIR